MRIFDRRVAPTTAVAGELRLSFEWRQKTRFRAQVARGALAGEEVGLQLERGTVLRDGDCIACHDGTVLRVGAAIEQLLQVQADDALHLARIAYHLGNRHVPVQVGQTDGRGWLRLALDHVLENMVTGLGGQVSVASAAFDPESGAYGHGHAHGGAHGHGHADEHAHGHGHRPDHGHGVDEHGHARGEGMVGKHDDRRHAPRIHDFLPEDR